jgi:hypothetical protein
MTSSKCVAITEFCRIIDAKKSPVTKGVKVRIRVMRISECKHQTRNLCTNFTRAFNRKIPTETETLAADHVQQSETTTTFLFHQWRDSVHILKYGN